ncbi:MAG: hypothetical protein WBO70_08215 [Erysipelotrichaceae bacterium]
MFLYSFTDKRELYREDPDCSLDDLSLLWAKFENGAWVTVETIPIGDFLRGLFLEEYEVEYLIESGLLDKEPFEIGANTLEKMRKSGVFSSSNSLLDNSQSIK